MADDPFTQGYNAIWDALEAVPDFAKLVKPGNRIKFSGDRQPSEKDKVKPSDSPEVRVSIDSGNAPQYTSSSTHVTMAYAIEVNTQDARLTAQALPVMYAILKAGARIRKGLSNVPSVKQVMPQPMQFNRDDPEGRFRGWVAVAGFAVTFFFTTSELESDS